MPRRIDSNPENFPIEIFIGAACSESFQYANPDDSPIDITGFTISLILTSVFDDLFKITSGEANTTLGSFLQITDGINGKFSFTISDEETATLICGRGRYAIQVDEGDGYPYILWRDSVLIEEI